MFEAIANFINSLLAALQGIARLGNVASNPIGMITGQVQNEETNQAPERTETLPEESEKESKPATPSKIVIGKRSWITIPENITARFNDKGSSAWTNQRCRDGSLGCHNGTDFGAPNGSAVYAPWDMTIVKIGRYDDTGRRGDYIIGTLNDKTEYYTGHLSNVRVKAGDFVKSGTHIADIGYYNHTHIQLRVNQVLTDFEEYQKTH